MTLTSKIKRAANGLDLGICKTFAFAVTNGFPTDYFPEEYSVLKNFKKEDFVKEDIPEDWLRKWVDLWPTGKDTNLSYAIKGTPKMVKERMSPFLKGMCERLGLGECSLEEKLDVIWRATVYYLECQESRGWERTKKAVKFIQDSESSYLELYIEKVLQGSSNRVA